MAVYNSHCKSHGIRELEKSNVVSGGGGEKDPSEDNVGGKKAALGNESRRIHRAHRPRNFTTDQQEQGLVSSEIRAGQAAEEAEKRASWMDSEESRKGGGGRGKKFKIAATLTLTCSKTQGSEGEFDIKNLAESEPVASRKINTKEMMTAENLEPP
ncbi:hypothetical protein GX51_06302 [Blastomyces parvus]|uniref:Uncharacterized protein n=1 Tax=Blastomyces parvus TaxID=2060905 RepID=A0A2B7WS93_9EURO|nr:hypothetical protein GX51_06302 [Blastomyces parvus]